MTPPLVSPGDVLAARYLLVRPLLGPDAAVARVWKASDEVLARPVAVKLLPAVEPRATAFLEAAARAGAVDARALTRVYDAAVEPRRAQPSLAYVVGEWVDGQPLSDLLGRTALPADQALVLARQLAAAVAAVHGAGAVHGRLHPGNVLVTADGRLRITDTAVAAVLHGEDAGAADDVRDLGALLYALLTGRWPDLLTPQPGRGLPAAPRAGGRVRSPRQVRAGVPGPLDDVVVRTLDPDRGPPRHSAASVLAALDLPPAEAVPAAAVPARRRVLPWAATATALAAVVAAGGYALMRPDPSAPPPPAPPATSAVPALPAAPLDLRGAVRDLDPYGRPPAEKPELVAAAVDGDPATGWTTDGYRTPAFGGLKPGVGLLVDLGTPRALARVEVDLAGAGTALEVRAGDAPGPDERALPVVARDDGASAQVRLDVPAGPTARYWLLWITRLPASGTEYRADVRELRLYPR